MPGSALNIPELQPQDASRPPGARSARTGPAGGMGNADSAADFARRLGKFQRESDGEGDPARNTAKELIAQGFILPMLKMARESEFKTGMFHGGQGEKAFGAQLDERLARRVAEQVAPGLVDAVYRKVHNNGGAGATGDGAPAQTQPGREVDRHG